MENQVEIPPPINLRSTFLGKRGRIEEAVDESDEKEDSERGELDEDDERKTLKINNNNEEYEPPKKKRKIDTESVEVDQLPASPTEYQPAEEQEEEFGEEDLNNYSDQPRRSNRKTRKAKRVDASDFYFDVITRKKPERKLVPTNYSLNVLGENEDFEILRERRETEKDEKKVNVIFSKENQYETGIFLIQSSDSLTVDTDNFFLLLYISSGYANMIINGGDPIRTNPGMSIRIPKGNSIVLENGKGCLVRISYTKLF